MRFQRLCRPFCGEISGLSLVQGLGSRGFRALLSAFGSPEEIYATPLEQLCDVVDEPVAVRIQAGFDPETVRSALAWLEQPGNSLITLADAEYPTGLLQIHDPPPLLYAKGNVALLRQPAMTVVGSRHPTPQGKKTAYDFAQTLSNLGYVVVSGMAFGIDAAAHQGALAGSSGTIAVIGTGIDMVYPRAHHQLAHEIAARGLILSEFPLGTHPIAHNFPRRNRIISGLGKGCLIVEAHTESGSLITARLAAEQGKEVFAIPGSIHAPTSKGCHLLIKQGAKLTESVSDVLEELEYTAPAPIDNHEAPEDDPLLATMGYEPVTLDTLIATSGLPHETLYPRLLSLEMEGKIATLPGGKLQRLA